MNQCKDGRCAFVFQGLGIEYRKYMHLLSAEHKAVIEDYCQRVQTQTGIALWDYISEGINEDYDDCLIDQLSVFTLNCAIYDIYTGCGYRPKIFLGYSLGFISALVSSKAVTFEQGTKLVVCGYEILKKRMGSMVGSMGVIVGLTVENIKDIIHKTGNSEFVEIAIENNDYCTVISGVRQSVRSVMAAALDEGALKVMDVKVSLPYHSKFIDKAAREYYNYARSLKIGYSTVPILSGVDQSIVHEPADIENEIYKNMRKRISLKSSIEKLSTAGINKIVEVGLGDSLTKLFKYIKCDMEYMHYGKIMGGLHGDKRNGSF